MDMIEDWSCMSQQDTTPYTEICAEAVENDEVFARFKQDPRYTAILEHVPPEHGEEYAHTIQSYELTDELKSCLSSFLECNEESDILQAKCLDDFLKCNDLFLFGNIIPF